MSDGGDADGARPPVGVSPRRWELVWRHRPELVRIAARRVGNIHDAEDVVSEALVRAARFANLEDGRVGAWLTAVTVRLCVDLHRARAVELRWTSRAAAVTAAPVDPSADEQVCDRAHAAWAVRALASCRRDRPMPCGCGLRGCRCRRLRPAWR
ncbi:RNA polymerase sigma factor [Amycolatopsis sp.]|uniref:RNA polymerase sigma factor n=1 Tax=Amycolatopsis sp. TaxID=37632 RepID=UPI0039C8AE62